MEHGATKPMRKARATHKVLDVFCGIVYSVLIDQNSILDGVSSWSAALVGHEFRIPVEFFLDASDRDKVYVQLKSRNDSGGVHHHAQIPKIY